MKLGFQWRAFLQQSLAMALFLFVQWWSNIWSTKLIRLGSLDDVVVPIVGFGLINLALMVGGDRLARKLGRADRASYMLLGAVAASVIHVVALAPAAYVATAERGELSLLIVIPMLLGAATGFLLHRTLGFAPDGDDPNALASAVVELKGMANRAFAATDTAEYYSGPLQVRDSSMAAIIAALIGSAIFVFMQAIAEANDPFLSEIVSEERFGGMASLALAGIISATIPFYIFVKKTHAFLQARGKSELRSYLKAALVIPALLAMALFALMGPFALVVVLPWILPSLAAIAVYFRLAGFEPLSLPEDIEVSDRRTLIAANHPRRQMHRIVSPQGFGHAAPRPPASDGES